MNRASDHVEALLQQVGANSWISRVGIGNAKRSWVGILPMALSRACRRSLMGPENAEVFACHLPEVRSMANRTSSATLFFWAQAFTWSMIRVERRWLHARTRSGPSFSSSAGNRRNQSGLLSDSASASLLSAMSGRSKTVAQRRCSSSTTGITGTQSSSLPGGVVFSLHTIPVRRLSNRRWPSGRAAAKANQMGERRGENRPPWVVGTIGAAVNGKDKKVQPDRRANWRELEALPFRSGIFNKLLLLKLRQRGRQALKP